MIAALLACALSAPSTQKEPVPAELTKVRSSLEKTFARFNVAAKFAYRDDKLTAKFHTAKVKVYQTRKDGYVMRRAIENEGPKDDGIMVVVRLCEGSYDGQAVVPQVLQTPHWRTFLNAPKVGTKNYLMVKVDYGKRTKPAMVKQVEALFGAKEPAVFGGK